MNSDHSELRRRFAMLADDELLLRYSSGELTPLAVSAALAEIHSRGLPVPSIAPERATPESSETDRPDQYLGDMQIVTRYLTLWEAHTLKSCLEAAGIPAVVGDGQTNALIGDALGGAVLRVPEVFVSEAIETISAFRQGQFELDDSIDQRAGSTDSAPEKTPEVSANAASGPIAPPDIEDTPSNLKTYRVYSHPRKPVPIVVKEGFSWGAFFIGPLWFLLNRMWLSFVLVAAFFGGTRLYFATHDGVNDMATIVSLILNLLFFATWFLIGKHANSMLCSDLEDRGYKRVATVKAKNTAYARAEAAEFSRIG